MNYDVTILMSTSPIPSHPDTRFIDEAVQHARFWFPDAPIIIMADGVWSGIEERRLAYQEYRDKIRSRYQNTLFMDFNVHTGQAAMTAQALAQVRTKYILFNEHDVIIDPDKAIAWDAIFGLLDSGEANTVRLSGFIEGIHPEHEYLVVGGAEYRWESKFWKTRQWSQWPHVASTAFYKYILGRYFNLATPQMIEEVMQSVLQTEEWGHTRTWVYTPELNAVRIHHLDARYRDNGTKDPCFWQ